MYLCARRALFEREIHLPLQSRHDPFVIREQTLYKNIDIKKITYMF